MGKGWVAWTYSDQRGTLDSDSELPDLALYHGASGTRHADPTKDERKREKRETMVSRRPVTCIMKLTIT